MRKLKRSECSILSLVLKKKWYELIAAGEKKEEYRDVKPYWTKRIYRWADDFNTCGALPVVEFALGYHKGRPKMAFLRPFMLFWKRSDAKYPEWGEPKTPHFVIPIGERVELED